MGKTKINYTFNRWQRMLGKIYYFYGWLWLETVFKLPFVNCHNDRIWTFVLGQVGYTRHPFYEIALDDKNRSKLNA